MKVSVAMAAYNGERYICEQLDSILAQLSPDDEVIVSDDCPNSEMSDMVKKMAAKDSRIRYVEGPCLGVIKNFEHALRLTTGDIIFLADQDDVWLPGKVEAVKSEIQKGSLLVMHDASVTDAELGITEPSFFAVHGTKKGFVRNIIKNSYMGCCMAFDKRLKEYILPFPEDLPMHDQYIGLMAEKHGKVTLLNKPYLLYRQHGGNVTGGKTTLPQKIKWRIDIIKNTVGG